MNTKHLKKNGQFAPKESEGINLRIQVYLFIGIVLVVSFLVWFVPIWLKYQHVKNQITVVHAEEVKSTPQYIDMTPEKIQKIQDKLLDNLSLNCETKGVTEPDGIVITDTNGEISVGRFMFQPKTVQFYVKKFEGKDLNRHDAIVLALDSFQAKELARKIVFSEKGGLEANWVNCSKRLQLVPQVNIIKQFMNI